MQPLDNKICKRINAIPLEEAKEAYAFYHEILEYGVRAVAHYYLMTQAKAVPEGRMELKMLTERYELAFGKETIVHKARLQRHMIDNKCGFFGPLERIAQEGIFIPQQALKSRWGNMAWYFDEDLWNIVMRPGWTDKEYGRKLVRRIWTKDDLADPELVEKGIKFGRDMWQQCREGFRKFKKMENSFQPMDTPEHIELLAEKLIEHYDSIVE